MKTIYDNKTPEECQRIRRRFLAEDKVKEDEKKTKQSDWLYYLCLGKDKLLDLAETIEPAKRAAIKLGYLSK